MLEDEIKVDSSMEGKITFSYIDEFEDKEITCEQESRNSDFGYVQKRSDLLYREGFKDWCYRLVFT